MRWVGLRDQLARTPDGWRRTGLPEATLVAERLVDGEWEEAGWLDAAPKTLEAYTATAFWTDAERRLADRLGWDGNVTLSARPTRFVSL